MKKFSDYKNLEIKADGAILIVTINRPHVRNAVDTDTAFELYEAFSHFDREDSLAVAILRGSDGNFCAGADLKEVAKGITDNQRNVKLRFNDYGMGPMGPSKMVLSKPVIAAVEGFAVAGI
jgi:enoyl-CoA hydratase